MVACSHPSSQLYIVLEGLWLLAPTLVLNLYIVLEGLYIVLEGLRLLSSTLVLNLYIVLEGLWLLFPT